MIGGTGGTMLDELYVLLGTRMDLKGLQAFERRIDATRRRMDAVGGQMMRWGATGAAAVGLIGNAVYQFEKKINAVNSVLRNATDEQKRRIKELTRELGATTQFTAPQAADAAFELAKAGFSPDEILDALPNVLNLAAAGDLGMAEAAKISVANLRGFKREVGELTDIMDMLAVASTSANTTIRELGLEALPNVAPIVAQMGGDIAPMMAMLARAQDAGIAASKTGVQMRQIMLRLITLAGFSEKTKKMARPGELEGIDLAPSKAQKTLSAIGIEQSELRKYIDKGDIMGAFRLLIDRGVTGDMALSAGLFDARSIAVFNAIAGSMYGDRGALKLTGDLEQSAGAGQEMAETRMEGIVGEILRLISALGELQLALGDAGITARIISFAQTIRDLVAAFKELDPETQSFIAHLIGLAPLLMLIGGALKFLAFTLGGLMILVKWSVAIAGAIAFIVKVGALLGGIIMGIGTIFGILAAVFTLPAWGLVAIITAALTGLAAGVWYFWENIVEIWNKAKAWLPDFFSDGGSAAGQAIDPMMAATGLTIPGGKTITVNDNKNIKVEVHPKEGMDAQEIAKFTIQEIRRGELTTIAEDSDDGVLR